MLSDKMKRFFENETDRLMKQADESEKMGQRISSEIEEGKKSMAERRKNFRLIRNK